MSGNNCCKDRLLLGYPLELGITLETKHSKITIVHRHDKNRFSQQGQISLDEKASKARVATATVNN